MVHIKILSLGDPERYAVRRLVIAAERDLVVEFPGLEMEIQEENQATEIGKYAQVLVLPTLVINEQVVCSGRVPAKAEVVGWIRMAITQK